MRFFEQNKSTLTATLLVMVLLGTGCASKPSVTEYQCRAGDWQTIGFADGAAGKASTRLLQHQEACGGFGIVPGRTAYLAGWQEGLANYCTADNGFHMGQRGNSLNQVCTDELREPYASAFADGRQLYVARRDVRQLSAQLEGMDNRLAQIKQELIGATTAQLVPDLTAEERLRLLAKVESLAEERAEIKAQIPNTAQALVEAEDYLAQLDQTLAVR